MRTNCINVIFHKSCVGIYLQWFGPFKTIWNQGKVFYKSRTRTSQTVVTFKKYNIIQTSLWKKMKCWIISKWLIIYFLVSFQRSRGCLGNSISDWFGLQCFWMLAYCFDVAYCVCLLVAYVFWVLLTILLNCFA